MHVHVRENVHSFEDMLCIDCNHVVFSSEDFNNVEILNSHLEKVAEQ